MVEVDKECASKEWASKAVGTAGLTTGVIGATLGGLNAIGGLGNLLGIRPAAMTGCCEGDHPVSRYEAGQASRIAELETEVKLRDANTYTDSKMLEMYKYMDGRIRGVETQLCQQAVINSQVTANISCMQGQINTLMGMTKTVIPIGNVCPEPMQRYNSWTAPTAGTTTT